MTVAAPGRTRFSSLPRELPALVAGERWSLWLFLLVLAAELLMLASGVPATDGQGTFLQETGLRLVAPFARLTHAAGNAAEGAREGMKQRQDLRRENEALAAEVERLRLEVARLSGLETEVERLASAIGYVRGAPGKLRLATIVYLDRSSFLRSLVLHAGAEKLEVDQPVLASGGLVGRVVQVAGPYARAQLITDTAAGVGAMLETNQSQGLVRGVGGGDLVLDYVPHQVPVEVGDRVVTAGIDGVYPAGVLIGTVAEVGAGEELFHQIRLRPAVDFGRLDHVFVLDRQGLPKELLAAEARVVP